MADRQDGEIIDLLKENLLSLIHPISKRNRI